MKTFREIQDYVITNNAFGIEVTGDICYSKGISIAMNENSGFSAEVDAALKLFESGNFGTFYDDGEQPTPDREYGCYKSSLGDFPNGSIMIHRDISVITVYFQFER